ncbi:MAG TPA: GerMN domain-containing protein [Candidatus Limnocylindria bacterium]|nr:GerMN domain-containing protein [Candidatus Limnocylindria bacterium]
MPRNLQIMIWILSVAVLIGLISLHGLHNRIQKMAETETSEGQARREVLEPALSTPTDMKVKAKIFWAAGADRCAPVELDLPLSADPVQRARQVLHTLIANPPTPEQRTIPADTILMGFYVLPDGTAIADFSDALASEYPSGIMSEKLAVDSIAQTLESNVPALHRLKILIHGQEVETLAGHVDLTGFFDLNPPGPPPGSAPAANSAALTETGPAASPLAVAAPATAPAASPR